VRCWNPADAPLLKEAIDSSLDHLRPWMPWAHDEPQPVAAKAELLRSFRGRFDLGEDYVYGLLDRRETEVIGGSGLHTRVGEGALEIGYWIRASRVGEGLATEAAAALTRVAFEVADVDRVEIRIDPANEASLRVPQRLGFRQEALLHRRLPTRVGGPPERDAVLFVLFADELRSTPAATAALEAYDALGARVL
jgi:RimJ/RimL family protein N-acetyltransferase